MKERKNKEEFIIEINYKNQKTSFCGNNQIKLEEIIKHSIKEFNINEKKSKNLFFSFIDGKGNTNKIEKIEDILNFLEKKEISENNLIKINLEINTSGEENKNNYCSQNCKNLYKIKELEEIIEKMKKEHLKEINKLKSEKNLQIKSLTNNEEKIIENQDGYVNNIIQEEMHLIEQMIVDLFKNEKQKFLNQIKTMKKEIIKEMKENINNNDKINSNNLNDIINNINNINSNIKDNKSTINGIENDLTNIIEKINTIRIKDDKEENKNEKDNKLENNKNTPHYFYNNLSMLPPFMNMNNIYKCENCNNCYILNECFELKENKKYNEHSLKLQNPNNNERNNDKVEDTNNSEENKNININIINNYIEEFNDNKKKDEKKEKNKDINNLNRIIDDNDEKEDINDEVIMKLNNILKDYFYKNGRLIIKVPTDNEQKIVNDSYKSLLSNNINIDYIKEYQNKYINFGIKNIINKLRKEQQFIINNRINKIKKIINDLNNNYK